MRPIPPKQREEMANDPYYKKCCYPHYCSGKIEWHHNLIIAGRQSDIKETILPLCQFIHERARLTDVKEQLDLIMLKRMSEAQIGEISKAVNYHQRLRYLKGKYENQS